jgi:hypothetical protein
MGLWSYSRADHPSWPKIINRLTAAGKVDPAADHQQGLAALLPLLAKSVVADSLGEGLEA